jgi:hypothetical protein
MELVTLIIFISQIIIMSKSTLKINSTLNSHKIDKYENESGKELTADFDPYRLRKWLIKWVIRYQPDELQSTTVADVAFNLINRTVSLQIIK